MATRATTLFSHATVEKWLRGAGTIAAGQEEAMDQIADWASEFIEKRTRIPFVTRTATEKYDGNGTNMLRLRRYPVQSVTTLKIKEEQEGSFAAVTTFDLFGADDPEELKSGEIRLKSTGTIVAFPSLIQNVEVVYVAGFGAQDSAALPADIFRAGLDLAKFAWIQHHSEGIAASQISIGPGNYLFKAALPFEIENVLNDWRQPLVA